MYKHKINKEFTSDFADFILNIKNFFLDNTQTIHKARNELKIIEHCGINTIVKSFKVPNLINQIAYSYFRDSKAKRSYEHSLIIEKFTPKAIGYIEFYTSTLLKESYFVSEKYEYDFTIKQPFNNEDFEDKENILKAFARFTLELHNADVYHHDYSPGNILIKKENGGYSFKIVDINRMQFFKLSDDDRAKNFSKLWADDNSLRIIGEEYIKHHKCADGFVQKMIEFTHADKKTKAFKNNIKKTLLRR